MSKWKPPVKAGIFCLVLGMAVLGFAAYQFRTVSYLLRHGRQTNAVVIENISRQSGRTSAYFPRLRFHSVDGREITVDGNIGSKLPRYAPGDTVEVLHDPNHPQKAMLRDSIKSTPRGFVGFGIFLLGVGGVLLAWPARRRRFIAWLRSHGQPVEAAYLRVELNNRTEMMGKRPFQIICRSTDPAGGVVRIFKSDDLWFDPEPYIRTKTLTVLLDPTNSRRYWVNTDFLPEELGDPLRTAARSSQ